MKAFVSTIHTKKSAVALAVMHYKQDNYIQRTFEKDARGSNQHETRIRHWMRGP